MSFLFISDNVKRLRAFLDVAKVPTILVYPSAARRGQTLELVAYGNVGRRVGILVGQHQFDLLDSDGNEITSTEDAESASEMVRKALSS